VDVGSGDFDATGLAALDARIGSGDVAARRIAGAVSATVGSGDVALSDVGSLNLPRSAPATSRLEAFAAVPSSAASVRAMSICATSAAR
jgi:hypothetical protein